jgi:hypothetical protein
MVSWGFWLFISAFAHAWTRRVAYFILFYHHFLLDEEWIMHQTFFPFPLNFLLSGTNQRKQRAKM